MPRKQSIDLARRCTAWLAVLAMASLCSACGDRDEEPAAQAITQIEQTVAEAGTDPVKYIPGSVSDVQDKLAVLKQKFEQKDFHGVLRDAPAVLAEARELSEEAAARKAEFEQLMRDEWLTMAETTPAEIETLRRRLEELATSKTKPAALSDEALARAQQRAADADALWKRALEQKEAGNLPEAVTLANQAREWTAGVAAALATSDEAPVK